MQKKVFPFLNEAFLALSITALADALGRSRPTFSWDLVAFTSFFLLFRIKVFLDDRDAEKELANLPVCLIKLNLLFSVGIWFLWVLAAISLKEGLSQVIVWIIVALGVSTAWLLIVLISSSSCIPQARRIIAGRRKTLIWLIFNICYLLGIFVILFIPKYFDVTDVTLRAIGFGILILVVLIDMCMSCSWYAYANAIKRLKENDCSG